MKKIFASILALTMLVCCLSISAFAAGGPTFTISDVTATQGDKLTINVNISNVPETGIASAMIEVKCDGDPYTYQVNSSGRNIGFRNGSWMDGENKGEHNFALGLANFAATDNIMEPSGQFVTMNIIIKEDATPGDHRITITSSDIQVSTGPDSFTSLEGGTTTATLTILAKEQPPEDPCANGHDWGEWVVVKEATPEEEGLERRTCKRNPEHIEERKIDKLPPVVITYTYSVTAGGEFTKGSGTGVDFTITSDPAKVGIRATGVKVDGAAVSAENYDVTDGKVTLKPAYLETLSDGDHTVEVALEDGSASTTVKVNPKPVEPPVTTTYTVTPSSGEYTKGGDKGIDFIVSSDPVMTGIRATGVKVDGKDVPADGYTVSDGRVTIKPEYLDTLYDGPHAITVEFVDGSASSSIIVKPAPVVPPVETKYTVEFDGGEWTKGSGKDLGVIIYTDHVKEEVHVDDILVDGVSVPKDGAYITDKGELFIDADYLETLSAGDHAVKFVIDGKDVEATLKIKDAAQPGPGGDDKPGEDDKPGGKDDAPKTGDLTNLYIYIAICLFAAAAVVGSTYEVKKNRG
ncbi:MAG: hypothetical protein IJL71_07265 [Oscillospiraceae bacterium]|nr:hypothetical protein [Oscillospiraceae bacterium]